MIALQVPVFNASLGWSNLAWGFNNGGKDSSTGQKVVDIDVDDPVEKIQALRDAGHLVM